MCFISPKHAHFYFFCHILQHFPLFVPLQKSKFIIIFASHEFPHQDILSFRRSEMREDYYAVLGCDPSASQEQIMAEYKARNSFCISFNGKLTIFGYVFHFQVRARQLHPDKQHQASPEEEEDKKEDSTTEFQLLQEVRKWLCRKFQMQKTFPQKFPYFRHNLFFKRMRQDLICCAVSSLRSRKVF